MKLSVAAIITQLIVMWTASEVSLSYFFQCIDRQSLLRESDGRDKDIVLCLFKY